MTDYKRRESDTDAKTVAAALRSEAMRLDYVKGIDQYTDRLRAKQAATFMRSLADAFDPPAPKPKD